MKAFMSLSYTCLSLLSPKPWHLISSDRRIAWNQEQRWWPRKPRRLLYLWRRCRAGTSTPSMATSARSCSRPPGSLWWTATGNSPAWPACGRSSSTVPASSSWSGCTWSCGTAARCCCAASSTLYGRTCGSLARGCCCASSTPAPGTTPSFATTSWDSSRPSTPCPGSAPPS